jgi:hypothetical protein
LRVSVVTILSRGAMCSEFGDTASCRGNRPRECVAPLQLQVRCTHQPAAARRVAHLFHDVIKQCEQTLAMPPRPPARLGVAALLCAAIAAAVGMRQLNAAVARDLELRRVAPRWPQLVVVQASKPWHAHFCGRASCVPQPEGSTRHRYTLIADPVSVRRSDSLVWWQQWGSASGGSSRNRATMQGTTSSLSCRPHRLHTTAAM